MDILTRPTPGQEDDLFRVLVFHKDTDVVSGAVKMYGPSTEDIAAGKCSFTFRDLGAVQSDDTVPEVTGSEWIDDTPNCEFVASAPHRAPHSSCGEER